MPTRSDFDPKVLVTPLWILALIAIGWVLSEAAVVVIWILSAFFLFALLDPSIRRLSRRGISPILSALILVGAASIFLALLGLLIFKTVPTLLQDLDLYRKTVVDFYQHASQSLDLFIHGPVTGPGGVTAETAAGVPPEVATVPATAPSATSAETVLSVMLHGLGSFVTAVTFGIITPVLTFFMMADRTGLGNAAEELFLDGNTGSLVWKKITEATTAFFIGNFVIAAISLPVFLILFLSFGVASPLTLAFMAAILNLIPFLGSLLTGFVPVLGLLAHGSSFAAPLALFAICVAIHFFVANLVTPKVLGSKLNLNATTSTIALVVFGELLGGMGLILAIPLMATIRIVFEHSASPRLRWFAELMDEDGK